MLARLAKLAQRSEQLQELALEKEASLASFSGKAVNFVRNAKNTGLGAVAGAGLGAIHGAVKTPQVDPETGRQQSRMSSAMSGAGKGALIGGVAGNLGGRALRPGAVQAFSAGMKAAPGTTAWNAAKTVGGVAGAAYGAYGTAKHLQGKYQQNQAGFDPAVQQMQAGQTPVPGMIQ